MELLSQLAHQFQEGGWAMWLILFWLVCSLLVASERFLYLIGSHQQTDAFKATVLKALAMRDLDRAIEVSRAAKSPLGRIVEAGLLVADRGPKKVQAAMDERALVELPRVNARIPYLGLFANLSMLCGLFGTIIGLIKSFGAVGGPSVEADDKARILAAGISEAMNCTAFGLLAAIMALVCFAFLNNWAQVQEDDIHAETVEVYNGIVRYLREVESRATEPRSRTPA